MSFGERLRFLIDGRGLTQKELAKEFNIAASTMGCYVQNTREPDFSTLKALADYFDVTTDYLLERQTKQANTFLEDDLLQIFRTLTPEQQILYIEQGKAFIKINEKAAKKIFGSTSIATDKVG